MLERPTVFGTTRLVYLAKTWVVKFPRASLWDDEHCNWQQLLNNMAINRYEAKEMRKHKGKPGIPELIFADPFGFMVVMKRYKPVPSIPEFVRLYNGLLDKTDLDPDFWEWDNSMHNFGLTEDGELVKIDL